MSAAGEIARAASGGYRGALQLREAVHHTFFGRSGLSLLVSPPSPPTLIRVRSGPVAPSVRWENSERSGLLRRGPGGAAASTAARQPSAAPKLIRSTLCSAPRPLEEVTLVDCAGFGANGEPSPPVPASRHAARHTAPAEEPLDGGLNGNARRFGQRGAASRQHGPATRPSPARRAGGPPRRGCSRLSALF